MCMFVWHMCAGGLILRLLEVGSLFLDWGRSKSQWLVALLFWPSGWILISLSEFLLIVLHRCPQGQKKTSYFLEVTLNSLTMWALWTKLRSPGRTPRFCNCWTISSAPQKGILKLTPLSQRQLECKKKYRTKKIVCVCVCACVHEHTPCLSLGIGSELMALCILRMHHFASYESKTPELHKNHI